MTAWRGSGWTQNGASGRALYPALCDGGRTAELRDALVRLRTPAELAGRAAGLRPIRLHDLRHFMATEILDAGSVLPVIASDTVPAAT